MSDAGAPTRAGMERAGLNVVALVNAQHQRMDEAPLYDAMERPELVQTAMTAIGMLRGALQDRAVQRGVSMEVMLRATAHAVFTVVNTMEDPDGPR